MPPDRVKLVVCDVDGVPTDGRVVIDSEGRETKQFSVLDGTGIKFLRRAGIEFGLLSGRASTAMAHRAAELGIKISHCGVAEKKPVLEAILARAGCEPADLCYVGDDLVDIPCLRLAGYPVAVAGARPEVISHAEFVTRAQGGQGAVREVAEVT